MGFCFSCSRRVHASLYFCHLQDEADAARAEGTIVYAVGVVPGPTESVLLDIGGEEANELDVDDFDVDDFDELDGKCLAPKTCVCSCLVWLLMMSRNPPCVHWRAECGGDTYERGTTVHV